MSSSCNCSATIGGASVNDQVCFLSKDTLKFVVEEMLKKIVPLLGYSSIGWRHCKNSLFTSINLTDAGVISPSHAFAIAVFALEILNGCFFCMKMLDVESELVACVYAAVLIINWDCKVMSEIENNLDNNEVLNVYDNSAENSGLDIVFCESIEAIRAKIADVCHESLSTFTMQTFRSILVGTIHYVLSVPGGFMTDKLPDFCCLWILDVFMLICQDPYEKQSLLDQVLLDDDSWQMWVRPFSSSERRLGSIITENGCSDVNVSASVNLILSMVMSLAFFAADFYLFGELYHLYKWRRSLPKKNLKQSIIVLLMLSNSSGKIKTQHSYLFCYLFNMNYFCIFYVLIVQSHVSMWEYSYFV